MALCNPNFATTSVTKKDVATLVKRKMSIMEAAE
jgi:hypothetical protein